MVRPVLERAESKFLRLGRGICMFSPAQTGLCADKMCQ